MEVKGRVQDTCGVGRLGASYMLSWKVACTIQKGLEGRMQNTSSNRKLGSKHIEGGMLGERHMQSWKVVFMTHVGLQVWVQDTCGVGRLSVKHM